MSEIYMLHLAKKTEEEIFRNLFSVVSEERKQRIRKFRFRQDAERALFAEALVQYVISVRFRKSYPQYRFDCNCYGKPFVQGHPEWQFNVSHAGKWVVCGFSAGDIGVDVEQIVPVEIELPEYAFSPGEYARLRALEAGKLQEAFFDLWTLKESYVKYRGLGLSLPLNQFEILSDGEKAVLLPSGTEPPCFFRKDIGPGYKLAVCTTEKEEPAVNYITVRQIWDELCGQRKQGV